MSSKSKIVIDPAGTVREYAIDLNGRTEYGPIAARSPILVNEDGTAITTAETILEYLKSEAGNFRRRYENEKRSADGSPEDDVSLYYKGKSDAFLEAYSTVRHFYREGVNKP